MRFSLQDIDGEILEAIETGRWEFLFDNQIGPQKSVAPVVFRRGLCFVCILLLFVSPILTSQKEKLKSLSLIAINPPLACLSRFPPGSYPEILCGGGEPNLTPPPRRM